ncbi:Mitochondrial Ribosome-Associated Gtpase 1 [Manis pentadactyla]|nr:Mitochondrial Ribosome-Associated Gtpase 1 [Manis pentadactyla]
MRLPARSLCGAAGAAWRESFPLGGRDVARWFPGHMAKGLKKMQSSLKLVDCIIEVHDARISFGRNPLFRETLGLKPHLLVLNKMDLADLKEQQKIVQHLEGEGLQNVIFTNCVKDENIKKVIPMVTELVGSSYRYHRGENLEETAPQESPFNCAGKATRVGGEPGITRAVMSRIQVCERPLTFLLDTPGVLAPRIESVETGLKLALCGTVLDHLVGEEMLADYLLYTLNRHQLFGYTQFYGLGGACDDIASVLKRVAVKLGKTQKVKVLTGTGDVNVIQPNYAAAARDFLRTFRSGLLGPVMLDREVLQSTPPSQVDRMELAVDWTEEHLGPLQPWSAGSVDTGAEGCYVLQFSSPVFGEKCLTGDPPPNQSSVPAVEEQRWQGSLEDAGLALASISCIQRLRGPGCEGKFWEAVRWWGGSR